MAAIRQASILQNSAANEAVVIDKVDTLVWERVTSRWTNSRIPLEGLDVEAHRHSGDRRVTAQGRGSRSEGLQVARGDLTPGRQRKYRVVDILPETRRFGEPRAARYTNPFSQQRIVILTSSTMRPSLSS